MELQTCHQNGMDWTLPFLPLDWRVWLMLFILAQMPLDFHSHRKQGRRRCSSTREHRPLPGYVGPFSALPYKNLLQVVYHVPWPYSLAPLTWGGDFHISTQDGCRYSWTDTTIASTDKPRSITIWLSASTFWPMWPPPWQQCPLPHSLCPHVNHAAWAVRCSEMNGGGVTKYRFSEIQIKVIVIEPSVHHPNSACRWSLSPCRRLIAHPPLCQSFAWRIWQ